MRSMARVAVLQDLLPSIGEKGTSLLRVCKMPLVWVPRTMAGEFRKFWPVSCCRQRESGKLQACVLWHGANCPPESDHARPLESMPYRIGNRVERQFCLHCQRKLMSRPTRRSSRSRAWTSRCSDEPSKVPDYPVRTVNARDGPRSEPLGAALRMSGGADRVEAGASAGQSPQRKNARVNPEAFGRGSGAARAVRPRLVP